MFTEPSRLSEFVGKMQAAGLSQAAIRAFGHNYQKLAVGDHGLLPETTIQPVEKLPRLQEISRGGAIEPSLLAQVSVVKLNGGLGTSMGLERAKTLLEVKDGLTFLDFIARQMLWVRQRYGAPVCFLLMNSFSTSGDTLKFLARYPELGPAESLELMQNQVPKVDAGSLGPVSWPANPQLEWCPPGHGDLYPSLVGSGWLKRLLAAGRRFMFVSNADNLGASLDLELLGFFATSGRPFLMEVAERTAADRKGGHLAQRGDKLILREAAQCPEQDMPAFQDTTRHRFFNTNNLWVRLDALQALLERHGGLVPLPLITNRKTVDPRDKKSPEVFQLETAMGAAIECFDGAGAVVVPRERFAPVKTTADLLAVRSDAYRVTEDWRLLLSRANASPPTIDLEASHYKLVDQLTAALAHGVPSLQACRELVVRGPAAFRNDNVFLGRVSIKNPSATRKEIAPGTYTDCEINL